MIDTVTCYKVREHDDPRGPAYRAFFAPFPGLAWGRGERPTGRVVQFDFGDIVVLANRRPTVLSDSRCIRSVHASRAAFDAVYEILGEAIRPW